MKYLSLLVLLFVVGCHSSCRTRHDHAAEVTSVGYGEIKIAPDEARFTVDVSFTKPALKEAVDQTQKIMNEVVNACHQVIADSNDVQTTSISAGKNFEWVNGANVFKGYTSSQSVQVTLKDLSKMEMLTQGVLETPVSGINNLEFDYSKSDSLRKEVNVLAMLDAKKTVQKMCAAVNKNCEELVSAKTLDAPTQGPVFDRAFAPMAAKAAPSGISVNPGLITFSSAVEATYRSK